MSVSNLFPSAVTEDLARSGLAIPDIKARILGAPEKAATGAPLGAEGYVIPYYDITGRVVPFYRVKLFNSDDRYRQIAGTPNYVYFPPKFAEVVKAKVNSEDGLEYVLFTEGEKKAAAAVKYGIPCVAVSGVDAWRNRTISLPKDIKLAAQPNGQLRAKLPAGSNSVKELGSTLAEGMQHIIDVILQHGASLIICFDTDGPSPSEPVARAAASLAFELRYSGIQVSKIRQLNLPFPDADDRPYNGDFTKLPKKVGLDDLLSEGSAGKEKLEELIQENLCQTKSTFPRYPNIRGLINGKLSRPNLSRQEQQSLSLAIISDLDGRGQRLRAPDEDQLYYFSDQDRRLLKVDFFNDASYADTPFGIKLYKDYGITYADNRIVPWLASQFSAEDPVRDVIPERVLCWRGDTLYYQLNDGQSARITKDAITIINNGDDSVLFEANMVASLDTREFKKALANQDKAGSQSNWWYQVLQEARIRDSDGDQQRKLLSLLYYISPYFYRWRGTQLPVEITTGEAGSGKSTLYMLRLNINTGIPTLRNAPNDMKDWTAGLANSGAMHVTDNVQLADAQLRQKLSDELCRLVTEPNPAIEQRKLYTNNAISRVRVRAVFAITAIKQPFVNVDIIQRSIVTDLDKGISSDLSYDGEWEQHQLARFGGRTAWVAHQLLFVQKLLRLAIDQKRWASRYPAKYRLINVEQLLCIAAEVVGWSGDWIPNYLSNSRDIRLNEADWALAGIQQWAQEQVQFGFTSDLYTTSDIVSWAQSEDDYSGCHILQNARSLGKYMANNKHMIATQVGLIPDKIIHNKQTYKLVPLSQA